MQRTGKEPRRLALKHVFTHWLTATLFTAGLLHSPTSLAFESWEHKAMGDMAFYAAVRLAGCKIVAQDIQRDSRPEKETVYKADCGEGSHFNPADRAGAMESINSLLAQPLPDKKDREPEPRLSFGDVVRCVDFFSTPERLIAAGSDLADFPERSYVQPRSPLPAPKKEDTAQGRKDDREKPKRDIARHCTESKFSPTQWTAAHVNHAHFQSELLVSISLFQLLSQTVARDQHNLYAALFIQAIQSHYLQDYFAPGHLTTPRAVQTDLFSTAMHDAGNEFGAFFSIDTKDGFKEVEDVLKDLLAYQDRELDRILWRPLLMHVPQGEDFNCAPPVPTGKNDKYNPQGSRGSAPDIIRQRLAFLAEDLGNTRFHGDKQLWRHRDCDLTGLPQRLVLFAMNTMAIRDVIRAYTTRDRGHGGQMAATAAPPQPKEESSQLMRASLSLSQAPPSATATTGGTASQGNDSKPFDWSSKDAASRFAEVYWNYDSGEHMRAGFQFGQYQMMKANADGRVDAPNDSRNYQTFSRVIGVSAGRESFTSGSRVGRNTVTLETVPLGWIADTRWGPINIGTAVGITGMQEGNVRGWGGQARLGMIIPQTETTISAWWRRAHHGGNAEHGWRNGFGLRMDQGFTSMFALYAGIGLDYGAQSGGRLERAPMVSVGLMIGAPFTRVRRIFDDQHGPARTYP